MGTRKFVIKNETRRRCHIVPANRQTLARLAEVNLELFHFLYDLSSLDFPIYFRANDELIEFIKPEEFSKELLEQVRTAFTKGFDDIGVYVLKKDVDTMQAALSAVRKKKLNAVLDKEPHLDAKSLEMYGNLSSVSQLVVRGGITANVAQQVARSTEMLVSNILDTEMAVATLSRMIIIDPTLYDHSASVAMIAGLMTKSMLPKALPRKVCELAARCGLYHDVGKTCIPATILNKPDRFTPEEWEIMKTHAHLGYEELEKARAEGAPVEELIARVALEHHERFDGQGYPHGRKGRAEEDETNGIHMLSRIVTVADVYSALLMRRVYKPAYEAHDAIRIMANEDQGKYDPEVFHPFLKSIVASLNKMSEEKAKREKGKGRIIFIDNGKVRIR